MKISDDDVKNVYLFFKLGFILCKMYKKNLTFDVSSSLFVFDYLIFEYIYIP